MSITCPHCGHAIKLKSVKAGRFQIKCTRCSAPFLLSVSSDAEPVLSVKALPAPTASPAPPAAAVPAPPVVENSPPAPPAEVASASVEATAPPSAVAEANADFSLAASAVAEASPDVTTALEVTQPPPPTRGRRGAANFEVTDAEQEEPEEEPPALIDGQVPSTLGGYQIIKELGRGGMGAVYLARQVSLDRLVALKVMNPQWAKNPAFLVRFTREAYAAAQLVHHNVVQVYDVGCDRGIHYFSMEFVQGRSLGELLKKEGNLDASTAAGYALQAARGLKFAHDRGMIHRDVKPDNLMLNDQGIVKVADLGLVRTPGMADEQPSAAAATEEAPQEKARGPKTGRTLASLSNVTQAGQSMGTPSYMAPEQARDATRVDHRADVYSLGCTLYVLVTGKPVFAGSNPVEVMTKHAYEPLVRPDVVSKQVPRGLADVIVKMLAKKPDDRYASMDEVIAALEGFLGLQQAGKMEQNEQHLRTLEQGVKAFTSGTQAKLRSFVLLGFFGGCAALFALLLLAGFGWTTCWYLAACLLGLATMTGLSYFVASGVTQKGHFFRKVRDFALSASWLDYLKVGAGLLLTLVVVWLLLPWWAIGLLAFAAILAVGLAVGLHVVIDRKVAAEQSKALEKVERMLKSLRLRGISEEAVQEFVATYAGDRWEEFFEALFGYESKLEARAKYGKGLKGWRPKHAGWRDPLLRWMDGFERARQEARERAHLQRIEQANLEAQGVETGKARQQAEAVVAAIVQVAAEVRQAPTPAAAPAPGAIPVSPAAIPVAPPVLEGTSPPQQGSAEQTLPARRMPSRRVVIQDMLELAGETDTAPPVRKSRALAKFFGTLFGGGIRFLIGAVLLAIALLWLSSSGLLPGASNVDDPASWRQLWTQGQTVKPLSVPLVPEVVLRALCSLGALIAGMVLIASALWRSWKIGSVVLLAAAVMVIGPVTGLVPDTWIFTPGMLCLAAGGVLAGLGFFFGRDT